VGKSRSLFSDQPQAQKVEFFPPSTLETFATLLKTTHGHLVRVLPECLAVF
jgi:hypothetical protein